MSIVVASICPKPRISRSDKWKNRECVQRYWAYKDAIRKAMGENFPQSNSLHVEFYIGFPKSYSQKKREALAGNPHHMKPDLDNLVKAVMDSLFQSDCHISHIEASKRWQDEMGERTIIYV